MQNQRFTVTRPNIALQLALYAMLVIGICYLVSQWHPSILLVIAAVPISYATISYILARNFKWATTIEIGHDSLTIIDRNITVIPFSNIQKYTVYFSPNNMFPSHVLIIKFRTGKKIKVIAGSKDMANLAHAFDDAVIEANQTRSLGIEKYDANTEFANWAAPIVAIGGLIIIIISILLLLLCNGFRFDYS